MRIYLILLCVICSIGCTLSHNNDNPSINNNPSTPNTPIENNPSTPSSLLTPEAILTHAKNLVAWAKNPEKQYKLGIEKAYQPIWIGDNADKYSNDFKKQLNNSRNEIEKVISLANNYLKDPKRNDFTVYKFYKKEDDGGAFANTYPAMKEFKYRDVMSKYAELFFQAEKIFKYSYRDIKNKQDFDNYSEAFSVAKKLYEEAGNWPDFPKKVNALMDTFKHDDYSGWFKENIAVMSRIHAARFKGEPELFLVLIATRSNSVIIENSPSDAIWGRGEHLNGANKLGLLYMIHRERFWYDFKKDNKINFDKNNVDHVVYMLNWVASYDG